ncbi:DUF4337 domain-containing protein [Noviherbaspirillum denitrificans]|uniref:DUF4337 domain-containing protein n=1 Tax=Noviherbaspirillum denitrificans TaxID=1968433 RepID=A0A254TE38_9BURK|nr:DUF4337 domain-containing protein [Noviherbaspirillum denitrificans]OWW20417.1 hypothetical protein AYR66_13910 [Noviherbaspirillum denitrificans]
MEVDLLDAVEQANEHSITQAAEDRAASKLNTKVAITVSILATFMGVCKVKDDNIVQSMQQAQANKIDHWAFYQARNIREEIAKATVVQLELSAANAPNRSGYDQAIARYQQLAEEQGRKKDELKLLADQDQKAYDDANFRDDQFDLSDALLAIAISLLAVTSLTRKRWLFVVAMVPTGFGILMGLAGLLGWPIHPTVLIRLLS